MNIDDKSAPSEPAANDVMRFLPRNLEFLIRERPTLWYENAADYDAMLAAIFMELSPRDAVEALLIKELVDLFWGIQQLGRLKRAAIHDRLPDATDTLCGGRSTTREEEEETAEFWRLSSRAAIARDDEEGRQNVKALTEKARKVAVTPDFIHYRAYNDEGAALERISRELERLTERRDRLLRRIEERRAALGAMARRLVDRDAEVIDIKEAK